MAKIRSTTELIYDSRNGNQGIIQLEISNWSFNPETSTYNAKVSDFVISNENVVNEDFTETTFEVKKFINSKEVRYESQQIDGLFYLLQNPIELTESYTSEMDILIAQALLYVTQQSPIYGSSANQWQIV
jgi:predicted DNA binding protein